MVGTLMVIKEEFQKRSDLKRLFRLKKALLIASAALFYFITFL